MTRRRWIADEVVHDRAALTGEHAAHLARVLRARVGQEFDISTGSELRRGIVLSVSDSRVEFELAEMVEVEPERPVTLMLAVFKFDRFEWAVEKCTELGVTRIVPIIARRTDSHLAVAAAKRVERWRRIALEASEQSRRLASPEIANPIKLKAALSFDAGCKIVLSENEEQVTLRTALETSGDVVLAIGPEGGWSEEESEAFAAAGWKSATLGSTILRAETAAIAAMAAVRVLSE